jgi:hypothetical protein
VAVKYELQPVVSIRNADYACHRQECITMLLGSMLHRLQAWQRTLIP